MYLYQDLFNSKYFGDYTTTLGIDPTSMSESMYGINTAYTVFFDNINKDLFSHYNKQSLG